MPAHAPTLCAHARVISKPNKNDVYLTLLFCCIDAEQRSISLNANPRDLFVLLHALYGHGDGEQSTAGSTFIKITMSCKNEYSLALSLDIRCYFSYYFLCLDVLDRRMFFYFIFVAAPSLLLVS